MWSQEMFIPDGYKIEASWTSYDIDDAVALLSGRAGWRVTEARRQEGNRATLLTHRLVCPHCRASIPAYADMQKLKTLARDFMPDDFIQTAETFDRLCSGTYPQAV